MTTTARGPRTRIASAVSSSDTVTTRAAPRTISATASGTGARQATPSTKVAASGVVTTSPAAKDRAVAGACSDTTPTICVGSPRTSRTPIRPQMPEPIPTGT